MGPTPKEELDRNLSQTQNKFQPIEFKIDEKKEALIIEALHYYVHINQDANKFKSLLNLEQTINLVTEIRKRDTALNKESDIVRIMEEKGYSDEQRNSFYNFIVTSCKSYSDEIKSKKTFNEKSIQFLFNSREDVKNEKYLQLAEISEKFSTRVNISEINLKLSKVPSDVTIEDFSGNKDKLDFLDTFSPKMVSPDFEKNEDNISPKPSIRSKGPRP